MAAQRILIELEGVDLAEGPVTLRLAMVPRGRTVRSARPALRSVPTRLPLPRCRPVIALPSPSDLGDLFEGPALDAA